MVNDDYSEVRLYSHFEQPLAIEIPMTAWFTGRFEKGMHKIADSLVKSQGEKQRKMALVRISCFQEENHCICVNWMFLRNIFSGNSESPLHLGKKTADSLWPKDNV